MRLIPFALAVFPASIVVTVVASATARAEEPPHDKGLVLRAGGDLDLGPDEDVGAAVVLGGNARIAGRADSLVIVGGDGEVDGGRLGDLTVIGGRVALRNGAHVDRQVKLVGSELTRSDDVVIGGRVSSEPMPRWGLFPFGLLFALGAALAVIAAGVLARAVAPTAVAAARSALSEQPGKSILAAVLVWILGPILAFLCFASIIGAPIGLGLLLFVLPALAVLGYLIAGISLGERVLHASSPDAPLRHPYLAATLGLVILLVVGAIPVLGALVGVLASLFGAGAIAVVAWHNLRSRPRRPGARSTEIPAAPLPAPTLP
jgi:hypothetical protein